MSRRVRRYLKAALSLLFLVLIAAACSSDGHPESYADQQDPETGMSNVEANWLKGCEVSFEASDLAPAANSVCACSFRAISAPVADGGIPFEDFVALNGELKDDPTALVDSETMTPTELAVLNIVENCIAES